MVIDNQKLFIKLHILSVMSSSRSTVTVQIVQRLSISVCSYSNRGRKEGPMIPLG